MNKQQLASKIWSAANDLRGKVSASNYKDYMLGLIFYKFVSEKEEKYLKDSLFFEQADFDAWIEKSKDEDFESKLTDEDNKTIKNCRNNIGYFIYPHSLFSYWINNGTDFQIKDVRVGLSAFNRLIGTNYKKVYEKIFDTLEKGLDTLGSIDSERTKAVRKLIVLINDIPVDGSQDYDVLGFVYEFLLKNFAANAGKAGEFYTPFEASTIMSEIIANHLKDKEEISIYDPCSGSGSLLLNIGKSVSKHLNDANKVKYYAQELIENTYNLTRMNLIMRNILPDNVIVRNGDTLKDDWPFFDNENNKDITYNYVSVDACSSNPPYSQAWDVDGADGDPRFSEYGVAPKSKADYAFLLHNLYHLKPDGIMTIVLPHGTLFRGKPTDNGEGFIRKNLIDKHNIETIIGLPSNMFFGTGIPTIIMVLRKNRDDSNVLFIDASKGFTKDGNKNKLRAKDVRKIVDTVIERKTVDHFSRLVEYDEIVKNEYNLNIPRYVDSSEKDNIYDIYSLMFGGIPNYEIDELEEYWNAFPSLRDELFNKQDIPYSTVKENAEEIIRNNKDVKKYIENFNINFSSLPQKLKEELIEKIETVVINKEEADIAKIINDSLSEVPLIDYYDSYQILDDEWTKIALDLEVVQEEGTQVLNQVDKNMVTKKNSKTKELYEVQEGWVGHIIPFELVQEKYFVNEKNNIDSLKETISSLTSKKDELLDSIDPNDKSELLKDDDSGDIETKKLNAVITKLKKEIKKGAEYDENTYEDIILKVNEVDDSLKKAKKELKETKTSIEIETKNKLESLNKDEINFLLENKWIKPLYSALLSLTDCTINSLIEKIEFLKEKYIVTLNDTSLKLNETEKALSSMVDELEGSDFDMKGLNEFKKIIGGENE